ncbi:MAG TPA: hypothetical protein VNA25_26365 [Phycisphaerae bacterium]|nr:hypothetical protein [Phycisphaerae bacterium]
MRDEVLSILRSARRKLALTRAAESAAVAATAAALASAAVELAWALAWSWPAVGSAICIACAAASAGVLVVPAFRARLGGSASAAAPAGVFAVVCLAGAAGIRLGWQADWHKGAVALIAVPSAALVAAAVAMARGAGIAGVAAYLDARASLRERVATAAELAAAGDVQTPSARAVYSQALDALKTRRPQAGGMWRRTPRTLGALGLSLLLCLAMAFLPDARRHDAAAGRLGQAVESLTADQRARLAEAFRKAAAAADDPQAARELAKTAAIVEVKDAEELERLLAKLQAAGYRPLKVVPGDILAAAGLTPEGAPAGDEATARGSALVATDANGPSVGGAGNVRVYHPRYAAASIPDADANAASAPAAAMVPYADAWAAARARASASLARGRVPAEYRRLVRDFFAGGD